MIPDPSTLLSALARLIAPHVAAELRAMGDTATYSTAPGAALPPGRSRRWLRDHARHIPGARREGGRAGRGVIWTVSRVDYEAWAMRTWATPAAADESDDAIAERALAASATRSTRGGAR